MSYIDLRDFEPEYTEVIEDLEIQVEKLGGGTVGRAYDGTWRYVATNAVSGAEIARGQDLYTGAPKTHAQVARLLMDFLTADNES